MSMSMDTANEYCLGQTEAKALIHKNEASASLSEARPRLRHISQQPKVAVSHKSCTILWLEQTEAHVKVKTYEQQQHLKKTPGRILLLHSEQFLAPRRYLLFQNAETEAMTNKTMVRTRRSNFVRGEAKLRPRIGVWMYWDGHETEATYRRLWLELVLLLLLLLGS